MTNSTNSTGFEIPQEDREVLAFLCMAWFVLVFFFYLRRKCCWWIHLPSLRRGPKTSPLQRHAYHDRHEHSIQEMKDLHCRMKVVNSEFLSAPKRTFENFSMTWETREEPPVPICSFQAEYKTRRTLLYRKIFDTALTKAYGFVIGIGLLAASTSYWIRTQPDFKVKGIAMFKPKGVMNNLGAISQVQAVVLPVSSFMLSLYVVARIQQYYRVMDFARDAQIKVQQIGLLFGSLLSPSCNEPKVREVLWQIYRYLNLVHIFMYTDVSTRFKSCSTSENLIASGYLDLQEDRAFEGCESKVGTLHLWLCDLSHKLVTSRLIPQHYAHAILDGLNDLQKAASMMGKESRRHPPISQAQMMQIMVDGTNLLTPFSFAYLFYNEDNDGWSTYMWPALGSMVLALFFQGLLKFVSCLDCPFDDDLDDLNPDWALISTDRKIFAYLSTEAKQLPALLQSTADSAREYQDFLVDTAPTLMGAPPELRESARSGLRQRFFRQQTQEKIAAAREAAMPLLEPQANGFARGDRQLSSGACSDQASYKTDIDLGDDIPWEHAEEEPEIPMEEFVMQDVWAEPIRRPYEGYAYQRFETDTLDPELVESTRAALANPPPLTLDEGSLAHIEELALRQVIELANALREQALQERAASVFEETALPKAQTPANSESVLNALNNCKSQEEVDQMLLVLIKELHGEIKTTAGMRSQLGEAEARGVTRI